MELRRAEEEVNEIRVGYQLLRETRHDLNFPLPGGTVVLTTDDGDGRATSNGTPCDSKSVLSTLEAFHARIVALDPKMAKFRSRSQEKDPVTGEPRFGPATQARVTLLLQQFDHQRYSRPGDTTRASRKAPQSRRTGAK